MTAIAQQPHPVLRALADARERLSSTTGLPVWSMTGADTTAAIDEILALEAQTAEAKARLVAHAGQVDLPGETAVSSTAKWLAQHTTLTGATASRTARFATPVVEEGALRLSRDLASWCWHLTDLSCVPAPAHHIS